MLKHLIRVTVRNIVKHKSHAAINIAGLSIGIACCLLISLWIMEEYSYDRFHENGDRIYMVLAQGSSTKDNPATPAPLAPALEEQFPEIEYAARYEHFYTGLMSYEDKKFYESGIMAVNPSFFRMFSFTFLQGDANTAFDDLYSIVVSEEIAQKYFGDENPMGKVLTRDNRYHFTVTGVIENVPRNSSLQFDMLVPFEVQILEAKERTGWDMGWGWFSPQTFVTLHDIRSAGAVEKKISEFFEQRTDGDRLSLMPFSQRYFFYSGTEKYIYTFSAIALLVLIMAGINFVNLATARLASRAKETGLRKVIGASRSSITLHFLGESVILSLMACIIVLPLVELLGNIISSFIGIDVSLHSVNMAIFLPALVVSAVLIGVAAGSYPAFFLSSFQPSRTLKGNLSAGSKSPTLRRILVVIQFSCSVLLIIGTTVIYKQVNYFRNKDVGYDKEHIINIVLQGESRQSYQALKTELLRDSRILSVSGSAAGFPYWRWTSDALTWDGRNPDEGFHAAINYVDYDLVETMGIEIVSGRSFSREYASDLTEGFLVNEEMAKSMAVEPAVGANLTYIDSPGKIVGVMRDFHFQPLSNKILPLVFALKPESINAMAIRIAPGDPSGVLDFIKDTWAGIVPGYPLNYDFLDEAIDKRYSGIERIGNLAGSFSLVAVLIACLGLFGLTSFFAEQRTREIGIRKVMGATAINILQLMSREFMILVGLANIIAWPVAYYLADSWLQNFAYHIDLDLGIFLLAAALSLGIALLSVSSQSLRSATANPVDSLRHE